MDKPMVLPSTGDYLSLVRDVLYLAFVEDHCERWAQPRWLTDILSVIVLILFVINIYAITLLITYRTSSLRNSFYSCVISLFVGEAMIMILSIREPDLQQCILQKPVQHLAFQTIGTFGVELTAAVNLTLAAVRLVTLLFGAKHANTVAVIGITISVIWSILMCAFHQFGLVIKIWYDANGKYQDEFLFPFDIIRIPLLIIELSATFLLYVATVAVMKTKSGSHQMYMIQSERRLLMQSLLTFLSELIYLYGTFWIGFRYLHLGDARFNANMNFITRPISVGLTPKVIEHLWLPCVLVPCLWTCRINKKTSIADNTKSIRSLRDEEEIREMRLSAEKSAELQSPESLDKLRGSKEKADQLPSPEPWDKLGESKEKVELSA